MRVFAILLAVCLTLFGGDLKPKKIIKLDSVAMDMIIQGSRLFACSANGDVYEIEKKAKKLYSLPHFTTPFGEKRAQKAFSLAVSPSLDTFVIAAEDGRLYIGKNGIIKQSGFSTNSVIKKVALLSDNLALIGLVSSQVTLFDISKNRVVYSTQIGSSPFSDMALSSDKKSLATVGEAGFVYILDAASGKQKALYKNINLDNIYKVDYQNGALITAGQDRRATFLTDKGVVKTRFDADFLVYSVALSPLASKAAVAINDQNDIAIFDTLTKSKVATAKGHNATLNRIVFLSETEFASSADENRILIWGIK